jgi:hypothetical protein
MHRIPVGTISRRVGRKAILVGMGGGLRTVEGMRGWRTRVMRRKMEDLRREAVECR